MSQLIAFLAFAFCVYASFHLYILVKARRAFYLERLGYILLFIVLLVLLTAPLHARLLEAQGHHLPATLMTWIGYGWMGLLFIFMSVSLPLDLYHLVLSLIQRAADVDLLHFMFSRRQRFVWTAAITLMVGIYSVFEAHIVHVETITLRHPKIPPEVSRVRIVQISDVHIGPMMFPARMDPVLAAVQAAGPDLLVSTGDLMDGDIHRQQEIAQALNAIKAPLGKYAVTGNHEFYAGIDGATEFTKAAGFTLLRKQAAAVAGYMTVVGIDDPAGGKAGGQPSEKELLAGTGRTGFILSLKHRPEVDPQALGLFDLQLSGHTHGGQMFPFSLLVRWFYPMGPGLHSFTPQSILYVSRGAGTWGPPMRFLAPPQITVIDLLPLAPAPPAAGAAPEV